jgi:hypothetical protein
VRHPNTWDVAKRLLHNEAVAAARGRPRGQLGQLPKANRRLPDPLDELQRLLVDPLRAV